MIDKDLKSSAITKASYNEDTERMTVTFTGGGSYDFDGVPRGVFDELCDCESAGKYFAENIKGNYPRKEAASA